MANNKNITFNQLEASMTKVKAEIDKKANTNHGTHVPTTGTANNATYLRNDNQWHKIVPSDIGAAPTSHGDHVTYSSTSPSAPGTASAGSAANVSRGDHVHPLQTTISGNAGTATKLQTARTLTIGNTGKSFNGSTNVSWSLPEIGAAPTSHNHTSLTGVTQLQFAAGSSDSAVMKVTTDSANTYLDFEMNDDTGSDMYRWRFSAWDTNGATPYFNLMTLTAKDTTSARLTVNGDVTASSFTGNASSATKLQNARTINGTSFNGTANITTANWGTARTLTIGSSGKSVNGSGNVSWSLSEIGAAAANHSHSNYAASSHEHNYLNVKGTNTIGSVNDDTTANWGAQGNSVHWYAGTEGLLHDQPGPWGYLVNIGQSSEVHQIWMTQTSGDLLHRGGNGGGWSGTWRTILDSSNYNTWAAAKSHTHDYAASNHTHNYAGSSSAGGNANAAVKLATARQINGTNFDGSGNITTANWGTGRTITIGNKGKTVNGSGNVSWSLSEIGALPAAGGTVSGNLNVTGTFSIGGKKITINSSAPSSPAVGDIWIKI